MQQGLGYQNQPHFSRKANTTSNIQLGLLAQDGNIVQHTPLEHGLPNSFHNGKMNWKRKYLRESKKKKGKNLGVKAAKLNLKQQQIWHTEKPATDYWNFFFCLPQHNF